MTTAEVYTSAHPDWTHVVVLRKRVERQSWLGRLLGWTPATDWTEAVFIGVSAYWRRLPDFTSVDPVMRSRLCGLVERAKYEGTVRGVWAPPAEA